MNYNDKLLDNKFLIVFKDVMFKLALAICLMLVVALVLQRFMGYNYFYVLTGSEYPILMPYNDLLVVKAQDEYKVGDILKFDHSGIPTVHRLIYIKDGVYFCHGDNISSVLTGSNEGLEYYKLHVDANATQVPDRPEDWNVKPEKLWEIENGFIQSMVDSGKTTNELKTMFGAPNVQHVAKNKIEGKVIAKCRWAGLIVYLIQQHALLLIAIVAGIWCISTCIENEFYMRRARRFEY